MVTARDSPPPRRGALRRCGAWIVWENGPWALSFGAGLIGLLVLFAAVVSLFAGRYPLSIFDFVLGMNRWVLRVVAYAGLLTDAYPPFRLDMGGTESGVVTIERPIEAPAETTTGAARWTFGRILLVVL